MAHPTVMSELRAQMIERVNALKAQLPAGPSDGEKLETLANALVASHSDLAKAVREQRIEDVARLSEIRIEASRAYIAEVVRQGEVWADCPNSMASLRETNRHVRTMLTKTH